MNPFPRKGSIVYNIRFGDDNARERTLKRWKAMDRFLLVPLGRLRLLPLLLMKNVFIVIQVLGRKPMKHRYIGISLRKLDDDLYVFLARGLKTQWYKNHVANPEETYVYCGFRRYRANISLLSTPEKEKVMSEYVTRYPGWSRLGIGWNKKNDDPNGTELKDYVRTIEIAQILLVRL